MGRAGRAGFTALATATAGVILAGTALAAGAPGGQSIGDPYYPNDGNTGYIAGHYDLHLTYRPGADNLSGTATIQANATQDLSRFSLDFYLTTSAVTVNGAAGQFTQGNGKLVVTPAADLPANQPFTVAVQYQGVPSTVKINDGKPAWVKTKDGAWAISEPHLAAAWFPSNDHPLDKATYDVSVAAPKGTQVISDGTLTGTSDDNGLTRWNWHSTNPQASYLQVLSIGHFTIDKGATDDGRPVIYGYDQGIRPDIAKVAQEDLQRTPEVLKWESGLFGPYPFEAEGGVVVNHNKGEDAEEFQTRPVYVSGNWADNDNNDAPIHDMAAVVHENAHQWFGDSVSVHHWRDIWLNEGFATYAEWLWSEHTGQCTAKRIAGQFYKSVKNWTTKPGDPGADNLLDDDSVYYRGALTLQALRNEVGDTAFFAILKQWAPQHRNGNAQIEQFISLAEQVSGKPLGQLFNTWLFTAKKPATSPGTSCSTGTSAMKHRLIR